MSDINLPTGLRRVEDLWFPDADLIFRAEDTFFRLYGNFLGARSSVFRDMVAFPQPPVADGDSIDGIPIVRLHDSAAEVEVFLRAVFDSSFFMPPPAPVDFATVIGVLRLAHKYDVRYLFRRALSHLDSLHPTDLPVFLETASIFAKHHVHYPPGIVTDLIVLRVASEVGAIWILPTAYYNVCTYTIPEMLAAGEPWRTLGPHEQQICLTFYPEMIRAMASIHGYLNFIPQESCLSTQSCAVTVSEARGVMLNGIADSWGSDSLSELPFDGLCSQCSSIAQDPHAAAQEQFWDPG
ncbi:hypothetical protein DFH07DRAFT_1062081 [Mycena maculata]|uniref:BTB domain-containing protein n=1 Tax=Mycena maculata TaxID=230809 RepID=A0AAD7IUH8_9AGAR|nr:hypothetical protein DFH07DRAFT_1062081 [Mycena maculata]